VEMYVYINTNLSIKMSIKVKNAWSCTSASTIFLYGVVF